jgi:diguanylate cyclase (GGDEF)-like protein
MPTVTPANRILSHPELTAHGGEAFARALRMGKPLTAMTLDIDFFKQVNDTWGRNVGDTVLRALVEIFERKVRKRDMVGRTGGDEFGFVLLDTDLPGARVAAERLRRMIATRAFPLPGPFGEHNEGPLHVTASIGLADLSSGGLSLSELFQQAGQALAAAKENGRNRVEVFTLKKED